VLVRGVVDDEVGDDPDAAVACRVDELHEVAHAAKPGIDGVVVGDVVSVVPVRTGIERHQPDAGDAEPGEMVDPMLEPGKVADPVAIAVLEGFDVETVEDRVLPPHVTGAAQVHEAPIC
jgi:hypothetical protein